MFNFDSIRNMEGLLAKKTMMLASCDEEKIVLLGGSSVLYGFNTDDIQRSLGKPVFNVGVNVGLGFRYLLDSVEPHLKPEDQILLPLEFNQYTNPVYYVFGFGIDTFIYRQYWRNRGKYKQKWKLLLISLKHAKSSATPEKLAKRKVATLTETGCYLGLNTQLRDPDSLKAIPFPETFQETNAMKEIAAFVKRCKEDNIRVTLLPPVFYAKEVPIAYLEKIYAYFGESIAPDLFQLDASEVYDSVYHANQAGQTRVTNRLIQLLEDLKIERNEKRYEK
ncbi:hypothetical protein HB848_10405 [Listeria rocourtiae]|uniref:hypothetical protein n=1 Tax=Listeria rocourtiae TaxID=647910 RepID=UPI00162A13FF|nr:hypothetical protein [Listeria rocourtiae]MBC1435751.1 hypothetical protein [Listeria rocourtiae]